MSTMSTISNSNPIKVQKTFGVLDSSKLTTYISCPRKFFYSYILGWQKATPKHDLIFGTSWHIAREFQLINKNRKVEEAYNLFLTDYRKSFPPETDEIFLPKTPKAAKIALHLIAKQYPLDFVENRLLYTEISGSVPINSNGRLLYFRLDSVFESLKTGEIFSLDHKTTKKFSSQWENNFYLSLQNGTYSHCLYSMYDENLVKGLLFCGTCFEFLKRGSKFRPAGHHISFKRVPAWKTTDQMSSWLWNVNQIVDELEFDMERLYNCNERDLTMDAFRLNPNACSNYWGCEFHDYCLAWANPIQKSHEPPLGFIEKHWDCREEQTTNKMTL